MVAFVEGNGDAGAGLSVGGPDGQVQSTYPEVEQLPRGRHRLSREFVIDSQRERLLVALADTVASKGYAETTVAEIARRARVSKSTFYEHYETKNDVFVDAYLRGMKALGESFAEAFDAEAEWARALKSGLAAMLKFLAANPSLAYLLMVEAPVGGPAAVKCHDEAMQSLARYLGNGQEASRTEKPPPNLPAIAEEALIGGTASLIYRRILAGEADKLGDLLPDLTGFMLTPYLGSAKAAQIAEQG
jgi:AcrR family transcriptional regulator